MSVTTMLPSTPRSAYARRKARSNSIRRPELVKSKFTGVLPPLEWLPRTEPIRERSRTSLVGQWTDLSDHHEGLRRLEPHAAPSHPREGAERSERPGVGEVLDLTLEDAHRLELALEVGTDLDVRGGLEGRSNAGRLPVRLRKRFVGENASRRRSRGRTNRDERGLEDEPVIHVEISGVWYEEDLGVDVLDDLGERRVQPRVRNRIEERGGEPVEEDRLANPERTIRLHGLSPHALHRCLVEHRRLAASDDAHIA